MFCWFEQDMTTQTLVYYVQNTHIQCTNNMQIHENKGTRSPNRSIIIVSRRSVSGLQSET